MGATGALGSSCVQVAKMLGAKVIAGAGADERVAAALEQGADFGVNYRNNNLTEEVMKLTDNKGVDVVCENIADPTLWPSAFASLAMNGRLVTAGAHGGGTVPLDVKRLYMRRLRIFGAAGTDIADVKKSLQAAAEGKIHAIIARTMPLSQATRRTGSSNKIRSSAKSFSSLGQHFNPFTRDARRGRDKFSNLEEGHLWQRSFRSSASPIIRSCRVYSSKRNNRRAPPKCRRESP